MVALAAASRKVKDIVLLSHQSSRPNGCFIPIPSDPSRPSIHLSSISPISHIDFLVDNTSAISSIYDPLPHPAQSSSLLFRSHIDSALRNTDSLRISVSWCPGHKGIDGNELVDQLAKNAVDLSPPLFSSTISWAKERAKTRPSKAWENRWQTIPRHNLSAPQMVHTATCSTISWPLSPTIRKETLRIESGFLSRGYVVLVVAIQYL
jgi:hypothetical protein